MSKICFALLVWRHSTIFLNKIDYWIKRNSRCVQADQEKMEDLNFNINFLRFNWTGSVIPRLTRLLENHYKFCKLRFKTENIGSGNAVIKLSATTPALVWLLAPIVIFIHVRAKTADLHDQCKAGKQVGYLWWPNDLLHSRYARHSRNLNRQSQNYWITPVPVASLQTGTHPGEVKYRGDTKIETKLPFIGLCLTQLIKLLMDRAD